MTENKQHDCSDCTHLVDPWPRGTILVDAKGYIWQKSGEGNFPWTSGAKIADWGGYGYDKVAQPVRELVYKDTKEVCNLAGPYVAGYGHTSCDRPFPHIGRHESSSAKLGW